MIGIQIAEVAPAEEINGPLRQRLGERVGREVGLTGSIRRRSAGGISERAPRTEPQYAVPHIGVPREVEQRIRLSVVQPAQRRQQRLLQPFD